MKAVDIIRDILLFVVLVLLQVLVLSRVYLFNIAVPFLYVLFIIKQPIGRNRFYVILSAFLLGITIDIFLNTPGVNAAAATIVATLRPLFLYLFYPKNEADSMVPGVKNNTKLFIRYSVAMVLTHHTLLFLLDAMTVFDLKMAVIRIASSTLLTLILLIAVDSFFYRKGRVGG